MASKRKISKKRMKQDQLVTVTVSATQFVQKHFTKVIAGVVILVAAIGIVVFVAHTGRVSAAESERELVLAMNNYQLNDYDLAATAFANTADRYGSQRAGVVSMFFLGQCNLLRNRYDEALAAFDRYLSKSDKYDSFIDSAKMGKAYAYEGKGEFSSAAQILEDLSETMDPNDGRYTDVLIHTARFYQQAGETDSAIRMYEKVSEVATGSPKERADLELTLLR